MTEKEKIDELLDCLESDISYVSDNFSVKSVIVILEQIKELYSSFTIARWWIDDQKAKIQKIIDDNQEECEKQGFRCEYVIEIKTGSPVSCKSIYLIDMDF